VNQFIQIRLIAAITICSSIALGFSAHHVAAAETAPVKPINAAIVSQDDIPVLPTIVVSAKAEIPVLPVVTVTPSKEDRRLAMAMTPNSPKHASGVAGSVLPISTDFLPHVRLDMPYYSFGKMMPRAIKD
jgi:hypothetical protein